MGKNIGIAGGALAIVAVVVWLLQPSPRDGFIRDMEDHVKTLNDYQHGQLKPFASEGLRDYLADRGTHLDQVVLWAHRRDFNAKVQYRFEHILLFDDQGYAEARFRRSHPGGDLQGGNEFDLPWKREDGEWKVASGFRDGRSWDVP